MFEDLKQAFNQALDAAMGDSNESASLMRDAVIEAKAAVQLMEEGIAKTEKKLARERGALADAVRRGGMAENIGDAETTRIAAEYAHKHQEKVGVLERKLEAQKAEISIARREVDEMIKQLKAAKHGTPGVGGGRPRPPREDQLEAEIDHHAKQDFAQRQLEELKRRMGK